MWKNLYEADSIGSEGGIILVDEEYKEACRITLERCERYCAVTCGVYGAMFHTAFSDIDKGQELYGAMKQDLQEFIDRDTTLEEEVAFYKRFTEQY